MRILARCGAVLVCLLAAACTVDRVPGAGSSSPPGGTSAAAVRPCPWSEERGQEYEAETGRIRLIVACLGDAHLAGAGAGFVYSGPDATAGGGDLRFTDGTAVAVLCVQARGGRFADSAGHTSTVWFQVDGTFAGGSVASASASAGPGTASASAGPGTVGDDATGWVPHAATGYASTAGQDTCPAR
jgi:hypothetical protein